MENHVRAEIIISGYVQKAGYRDLIQEIAIALNLTGLVKNLENKTVHVLCEGDKKSIENFLQKINIKEYPIIVKDVKVSYSESTNEFKDFSIIREEDMTAAIYERMDLAARYLRETKNELRDTKNELKNGLIDTKNELKSELRETRNELKSELRETRNELKNELRESKNELGKKLDLMNSDINKNFSAMAVKYDKISGSVDEIAKQVKKEY